MPTQESFLQLESQNPSSLSAQVIDQLTQLWGSVPSPIQIRSVMCWTNPGEDIMYNTSFIFDNESSMQAALFNHFNGFFSDDYSGTSTLIVTY